LVANVRDKLAAVVTLALRDATPITARTAGWIAHWKEMIEDTSQRIGRPRQLYTGATLRTYVPMEARS
jgi:citrate synthase